MLLKFCIFAQVYASMFDAKQVVFVLHLRQGNVLLVLSATSGELYAPSFDLCGQKYSLLHLLHENLYLLSILAYFMLAILCAAKGSSSSAFCWDACFAELFEWCYSHSSAHTLAVWKFKFYRGILHIWLMCHGYLF